MTSKERVFRTLAHQEPDRVPWGEFVIDGDVIEKVLGRETLLRAKFRETKAYWEGRRDEVVTSQKRDTVDIARALGLDLVIVFLVPPKGHQPKPMKKIDGETYEDEEGNLWRVSISTGQLMPYKRNAEAYVEPKLEEIEKQIRNFKPKPKPDDSEFELIRYVVDKLGKSHFIALRTGDINFPFFGRDDYEHYTNLIEKQELCKKINELKAKEVISNLSYFVDEGIDALAPGADYAHNAGPFASPAIFREMVLPWLRDYCHKAHQLGFKILKHACGNNWQLMDMFVEAGYDGYQSIQTSAGMDMKLLKERYGDSLTLWGGVSVENLVGGSPEDVEKDAKYALRYGAPGGGYIYGSSHSLAVGTKYENLKKMKETLDRIGKYPIRV